MLTEQEIGREQFEKAKSDRARFRGIPGQAREYAESRGADCARVLAELKATDHNAPWEAHVTRIERDAVMLARQAFRGWRAYRIMKG